MQRAPPPAGPRYGGTKPELKFKNNKETQILNRHPASRRTGSCVKCLKCMRLLKRKNIKRFRRFKPQAFQASSFKADP